MKVLTFEELLNITDYCMAVLVFDVQNRRIAEQERFIAKAELEQHIPAKDGV